MIRQVYNFHGIEYPILGYATYRDSKWASKNQGRNLESRFLKSVLDPKNEGIRDGVTYEIVSFGSKKRQRHSSYIQIVVDDVLVAVDSSFFEISRKRE